MLLLFLLSWQLPAESVFQVFTQEMVYGTVYV